MLGIVVYTIGTWEGFHRRRMLEALARNLRGRGFLLVVEPPLPLLNSRHLRDWRPAARALVRAVEQRADNLWLVRPTLAHGRGDQRGAYTRALGRALKRLPLRPDRLAAWLFRPDQHRLLGAAEEDCVVYECYDEYRLDFHGREIPGVYEQEQKLLAAAQVVLTTSHPLHESRSAEHPNVHYTPNGVDYALFATAREGSLQIPDDLRLLPQPVIGYIGNFTYWVDSESLEEIIRALPDIGFGFIGPVTDTTAAVRVQALPNVRFFGVIPSRFRLPAYLKGMGAAMCLLRPNGYARCMLPLTVLEYLAAGKPVVVRPSPSLTDFEDLLYAANTPEEAVAAIRRALAEDCEELRDRRQARAREYDWDVLTKRTAQIVLEACE